MGGNGGGGIRSRVSIALIDPVALGDYVIVHAGYAISRLDVEEAEKSLALFEEIALISRARSCATFALSVRARPRPGCGVLAGRWTRGRFYLMEFCGGHTHAIFR